MTTMIQIRHVPPQIHSKLKARAALEGMSLSDFLRREVAIIANRPTTAEFQARLAARPAVRLRRGLAQAVRAERDSR